MKRPRLLRPAVFAGNPRLAAGFTTRHGGVSEAPYATLNLGLSTADEAARVRENRRRLAEALGFAPDALGVAGQVHGAEVRAVDAPGLYVGFDGLVTAAPGVLLCITAADCAAVLLADAGAGVVGACHAGWRGAAAGIVPETVEAMTALGASPVRMRAYVGPCISAAHFEVGPEVAERFAPAFVRRFPGKDRPHVALKAALAAQLAEAGLPGDAVEVSPRCTFAETRDFFSHRAEGGVTGRMMGVIGMRA